MNTKKLLLIITCTVALCLAVIFVLNFQLRPGWDFRNNLWGPAHLLVNHQSPYRVSVLFEHSNAIWMPMPIGAGFLIGYLPLQQAYNLWMLVNILALILVVFLSAWGYKIPPLIVALLILFLALFPSTVGLLVLGQISLVICLIMLVVILFDQQIHPLGLGLLLALSLAKPQLSFFFIFAYLVLLVKNEGLKKALYTAAFIALGVLLTTLPLFFFYPNWMPDFISNVSSNGNWMQPTIYFLLFGPPDPQNFVFRVLLFLSGLLLILYLSLRLPKRTALLWSIALTLVFSPYIWSWDFVLLFPILIQSFVTLKAKSGKFILAAGYIVCLVLFLGMKFTGRVSDELTWWVPLFLIFTTLLSTVTLKSQKALLSHSQ